MSYQNIQKKEIAELLTVNNEATNQMKKDHIGLQPQEYPDKQAYPLEHDINKYPQSSNTDSNDYNNYQELLPSINGISYQKYPSEPNSYSHNQNYINRHNYTESNRNINDYDQQKKFDQNFINNFLDEKHSYSNINVDEKKKRSRCCECCSSDGCSFKMIFPKVFCLIFTVIFITIIILIRRSTGKW